MLKFLDEKFPKLARQYRDWFKGYGDAPQSYRKEISERIERLRRKYGLGSRPKRPETARSWRSPQLELRLGSFGDGGKLCQVQDHAVANVSPEGLLEYKTV
jgi:hypothetical protein